MTYENNNTLYLLKFNNNDILFDECGNKWRASKNSPYVSNDGIIYPAINFSGFNYIETNISKFNLNSNWTIDFWLYLEEDNSYLTYLSVRGDSLIISNSSVILKTEDNKFQKIKINIPLNKWIHFALTKFSRYISVHINGFLYTFITLEKKLNNTRGEFPNILTLGKSSLSQGIHCSYKLMHFRISDIARFKIEQTFNPLSTLGYLTSTQRKILFIFNQKISSLQRIIKCKQENIHNINKNIIFTITTKSNIQRNIKHRYYKIQHPVQRKIKEGFMTQESRDFVQCFKIINDNTTYLLKFNNNDILFDECGNKWRASKNSPYVSNDGIIYPAINFSGFNYIETNISKFNLNSNWTIDFWLYLEEDNNELSFLSVNDTLIIKKNSISIKLINNEYNFLSYNIPLNKWIHFALTKFSIYISVHINGSLYTFITLSNIVYTENNTNILTLGKSSLSQGIHCSYKLMHFRISDIARFKIEQTFNPLSTLGYLTSTQRKILFIFNQKISSLQRIIKCKQENIHNINKNIIFTITTKSNIQRNIKHRYYKIPHNIQRKIMKLCIEIKNNIIFSNGPININNSRRIVTKTFEGISFNTLVFTKLTNYFEYHKYYTRKNLLPEEINVEKSLKIIKTKFKLIRQVEKDKKEEQYIPQLVIQDTEYDKNYEYEEVNISSFIYIKNKYNMQRIIFKNVKIKYSLMKLYNNKTYNTDDENYYYDPLTDYYPLIYINSKFNLKRNININVKVLSSLFNKSNYKYHNEFEYSPIASYIINKIKFNTYKIVKQDKPEIIDNTPTHIIIQSTDYDQNYEYEEINTPHYIFINSKFNLKRNININVKVLSSLFNKSNYKYHNEFEYSPIIKPIDSVFIKKIYTKHYIIRNIISDYPSYTKYTEYKIRMSNYDMRYSYNPLNKSLALIQYKQKINTIRIINYTKQPKIDENKIKHDEIEKRDYDQKYEYNPLPLPQNIIKIKIETLRIIKQNKINIYKQEIDRSINKSDYDNSYEYNPLPLPQNIIKIKIETLRIIKQNKINIYKQEIDISINKSDYDNSYEYNPLPNPPNQNNIFKEKINTKRIIKKIIQNITQNKNVIRKSDYDNSYEYNPLPNPPNQNNIFKEKINTKRIIKKIIQNITQNKNAIRKSDYDNLYEYKPLPLPQNIIKIKIETLRIIKQNKINNRFKQQTYLINKKIIITLKINCARIIYNDNNIEYKYFLTPELIEYYKNFKDNFNIHY